MLSAQDVAMQLALLFCAEMLYSGLYLQAQTSTARRPKCLRAIHAGTVRSVQRLGSSSRQERSEEQVDLVATRTKQPPRQLDSASSQLALAEWLGIFAFAACLVLEVLIRRHDCDVGREADAVGGGGEEGVFFALHVDAHVGVHAAAQYAAVPVPRTIMRALVSGGLLV